MQTLHKMMSCHFYKQMLLDILSMTVCYRSFSFSLAYRRCGRERIQRGPGGMWGEQSRPPPACRPKVLKMKHHCDWTNSCPTSTSQKHLCLISPRSTWNCDDSIFGHFYRSKNCLNFRAFVLPGTKMHTLTQCKYQRKPHQTIRGIQCEKRNLRFCCRPVRLK